MEGHCPLILILGFHEGSTQTTENPLHIRKYEEVTLFEEVSPIYLLASYSDIRSQNSYPCFQLAKWIFFLTLG